MPRRKEMGKRRKKGRRLGRLLLGAAGMLVGLAGCSSLPSANNNHGDPLLGEQPHKHLPPRTSAAPVKTGAEVPPIPPPHLSSSPAALASLSGGQPLAIDDRGTVQTAGGSPLRRPEPVVQPLPPASAPQGLLTAGSWVPATQATATPDPWQAQLQARGVLWQRQDRVPEGIKLTALVPLRQQPGVTRIYEAVAADYPGAAQALLRQIDAQR